MLHGRETRYKITDSFMYNKVFVETIEVAD